MKLKKRYIVTSQSNTFKGLCANNAPISMSQMDRKEDRKEAIKFGPAQPRARQSDQLNAAEV